MIRRRQDTDEPVRFILSRRVPPENRSKVEGLEPIGLCVEIDADTIARVYRIDWYWFGLLSCAETFLEIASRTKQNDPPDGGG